MASVPMVPVSMKSYVPGAEDVVEPVDEVRHGCLVVVLDLHQPDDVGVEADERAQDLRPLAVELERGVRAAALKERGTADVGAVAAAGVGVQRREVVEDIHRRHLEAAADGDRGTRVVRWSTAKVGRVAVGWRRYVPKRCSRTNVPPSVVSPIRSVFVALNPPVG